MTKTLPRPRAGQRFGRLRVLIPEGRRKGLLAVLCICDCGNLKALPKTSLLHGFTRSCGCLGAESRKQNTRTHGMSNKPIYAIWRNMRDRCQNPNHQDFYLYGGRGIRVCDRWQKFENFFADMGHRPKGKTLDRKNGNKDYSSENCRWATPKQQARNTRRNRLLTFQGKTQCVADWTEECGYPVGLIVNRLGDGWSVERALTTPCRVQKNNRPVQSR